MPQQVARTTDAGDGIVAIDTLYLRPSADASHLVIADGHAAFVDTGTNASVPLLLESVTQVTSALTDQLIAVPPMLRTV